jgi:hypothetical protein
VFIIGRWKSVALTDAGGKDVDRVYEIEFVNDGTVDIAQLSGDGRFLYDGSTASYSFIDSNTLSVVSPRAEGEARWDLERNGDSLIIIRTLNGRTDRLVLERH